MRLMYLQHADTHQSLAIEFTLSVMLSSSLILAIEQPNIS
jgi:hypothetical protein